MSLKRFALTVVVVFIISQVFAIVIHGFILGPGHNLFGIVPVNTEDNFLHLFLGLLGLGAGSATPVKKTRARASTAGPSFPNDGRRRSPTRSRQPRPTSTNRSPPTSGTR